MARTNTLGNFLTDVADAIRTKKGSEEPIAAEDFDTEIENLPSGGDLSEYFVTEITQNTIDNQNNILDVTKKAPNLIISDNVTSLNCCFYNYTGKAIPKVVCNNNVLSIKTMFANTKNISTIDVSEMDTSNVTNMEYTFQSTTNPPDYNLISIIFSQKFDTKKVTSMKGIFANRKGLTELDLSNFYTPVLQNAIGMFSNCTALEKIDMRNMTFDSVTSSSQMFGTNSSNGPADNCEIIVKSDTEKTWITTNFSRLTNIKTVAEYEAEQNA